MVTKAILVSKLEDRITKEQLDLALPDIPAVQNEIQGKIY